MWDRRRVPDVSLLKLLNNLHETNQLSQHERLKYSRWNGELAVCYQWGAIIMKLSFIITTVFFKWNTLPDCLHLGPKNLILMLITLGQT